MTIEYKDSKRIVGLSTDIVETVTYETDFSTNTGWNVNSASSFLAIDTTDEALEFYNQGLSTTFANIYYDLGANVSETKWIMRCSLTSDGTASTDEPLFKFEINNTSNAMSNTNSDAIGFHIYTDRANTWQRIYGVCKDSTTSVRGAGTSPTYWGNLTTGTRYYITMTRTSATNCTLVVRTGSHTGSIVSSGTLTQNAIPSTLTGLRYLTAQNYGQGQGKTMKIYDLEFYNGVSSLTAKPTDVPDNSILVEKDTAKRYWFSELLAPTKEFNFSSSTGWVNAGSVFDVNTTTEQLEGSVVRPFSGANNYHYYDLIGGTISDTAWRCDFKLVVDVTSYSTVRGMSWIALSSVTGSTSGSLETGDHMGMVLYINAGIGNFYATHVNGGTLSTNTISSSIDSGTTTYYVSLIRNGDNFQFDLYSDIDRTVLVNSVNGTTSGIADLRYLRIQGDTDAGATYTGDVDFIIDDLKFYNGVTSVTPATWTRELPTPIVDDFSTDNWTDNDSTYIGVSGGSMNWNCKRDGTNDASVYDLTSTSANWVLRFKLKVTNVSSSTLAGNGFFVGLSDSDQSVGHGTSQDFIGVSIYNDNTDTYHTIDADGSALPHVYQGDSNQSTTYNTNSVWYYEIIKTGSSYTVEAFSGSDYSTGSEGKITGSSNASGLRYLKVLNDSHNISTSTNPFQGTIDDLEFYDGVTDLT
jgi:hypothetical protein